MPFTSSWTKLPVTLTKPCSSFTAVHWKGCIYTFGGKTNDKFSYNDLFRFDLKTNELELENKPSLGFPPRYVKHDDTSVPSVSVPKLNGHSCVVYNSTLFIFGGMNQYRVYNDLYTYNLKTNKFVRALTSGDEPSPRYNHSVILIGNRMIIFGGGETKTTNDCYELNLDTLKWTRHVFEEAPKNQAHSAIEYNKKMIIYGGFNNRPKDDLLEFDFEKKTCINLESSGDVPPPLYFHCAVRFMDDMFVFGGKLPNMVLISKLGKLHKNNKRGNDLYKLDLITKQWTKVIVSGAVPAPRSSVASVLVDDTLYILGGVGKDEEENEKTVLSDIWTICLSPFSVQKIYKNIGRIFNDKQSSDITFDIDGEEFYAHKCIITQSPILEEIIEKNKSEKIKMPKGFEHILKYLYLGQLQDCANLYETFQLADEYKLEHLKRLCLKELDDSMSINVDVIIPIMCDASHIPSIVDLCIKHITKNKDYFLTKKKEIQETLNEDLVKIIFERLDSVEYSLDVDVDEMKECVSGFGEHLRNLRKTNKYSDVILISKEGKEFSSHKAILMALDDYFFNMFHNSWIENEQQKINMDTRDIVLQFILDWLYQLNPQVPDDIDDLFELYDFGRMLTNAPMKSIFEHHIMKKINAENVLLMMDICKNWQVEGCILNKCKEILNEMEGSEIVSVIKESYQQIIDEQNKRIQQLTKMVEQQKNQIDRLTKLVEQLTDDESKKRNLIHDDENLNKKRKY